MRLSRRHAAKLAAADAVRPALAFPHSLHHGFVALLGTELAGRRVDDRATKARRVSLIPSVLVVWQCFAGTLRHLRNAFIIEVQTLLFQAGVLMTSTNGSNGNGYTVPKPRAEWLLQRRQRNTD